MGSALRRRENRAASAPDGIAEDVFGAGFERFLLDIPVGMRDTPRMSRILVPTESLEDWQKLLSDPVKHWKKGHSAMAVAKCWEASNGLPAEISGIFGMEAQLILAIPEHQVPIPGGKRPSQCDVFALVGMGGATCALAVEAKVEETFGDTIGEWQKKTKGGGEDRLTALCEELDVPYPPPADLRYRLFHRTVAAVYEADRFRTDLAAMIVQSFSRERAGFEDFAAFCNVLGLEAEPGTALRTELPSGRELLLGWAEGSEEFLK